MRSRLFLILTFVWFVFPAAPIFSMEAKRAGGLLTSDDLLTPDDLLAIELTEDELNPGRSCRVPFAEEDSDFLDAGKFEDYLPTGSQRFHHDSESSSGYETEDDSICVDRSCACKVSDEKRVASGGERFLIYRQATIHYFSQILSLCETIRSHPDDSKKLLMRPGHFLNEWILAEIKAGHFYVAVNQDGLIVAFVRVFLVKQRRDIRNLLLCELKCTGPERRLKSSCRYVVNLEKTIVPGIPDGVINPDIKKSLGKTASFEERNDQIFMYYGTHYTTPEHRGLGVGSRLVNFAIQSQFAEVLNDIDYKKDSAELVLLYGNISGNCHSAILRSFAWLIENICWHVSNSDHGSELNKVTLRRYSYETCKPDFYIEDGSLKHRLRAREDCEDEGCAVTYELTGGFRPKKRTPKLARRFAPVVLES